MSTVNMAKNIKEINPDFVVFFKVGSFYHCYFKDAYIISYLFWYFIKTVSTDNVAMVGFPLDAIFKVKAKLESKKINYILVDVRNNYDEDEKSDNKNLNTYYEVFEKAHKYIKLKKRINKISEGLMFEIESPNFKEKLRKIEEIIDEDWKN